jgi:hypothetical protein
MHDLYGDWLTIERVIREKGAQYKILSSTGQKVKHT